MPYDNSVMESFFNTLKREELYRRMYRSEREFRVAIDEYIVFYNSERPSRMPQYKTPDQKDEKPLQIKEEPNQIEHGGSDLIGFFRCLIRH